MGPGTPRVPGSHSTTPEVMVTLCWTIRRPWPDMGAEESSLDWTPGPGSAQPSPDPALGRVSLQLGGCQGWAMPLWWPAGGCPGHPVLGPSCHAPWSSLARPTLLRDDVLTLGSLPHCRTHTLPDPVAVALCPTSPQPDIPSRPWGCPAGALRRPQLRAWRWGTPKPPALTGEPSCVQTSAGRSGASRLLRAG